ncbi:MAG: hypothetical protein RL094_9 [Candidatus Parcubacteria bacterium]|jgi:TatD DNase family protein
MSQRPEYIDIHAHLNFAAYDADRAEVAARAKEQGVWMINVGTSLQTSKEVVQLSDEYTEGVYSIIGLHPVHSHSSHDDEQESTTGEAATLAPEGEEFDVEAYEKLIQNPKVVAVGECGLDYFHLPEGKEDESKKVQEKAFRLQVELAMKYDKPIMIHARQSYTEILGIIDEYLSLPGSNLRGNVHFFAGTIEEAQAFLDRGFTLSFTGVVTFAKQYEELVRYVPLDRMMSETDCPYVAPVPYRGRRNEPLYVTEVVKKIAEIKGLPLEEVKKTLVDNAFKAFKLA